MISSMRPFRPCEQSLIVAAVFTIAFWVSVSCPAQDIQRASFRKVTTIVGNGKIGPAPEMGVALLVPISNPFGVQPEKDGSLILASYDQHAVYRLDSSYRKIDRIVGTGNKGLSGREGDRPLQVDLNQPHEVQVDDQGNIYVADTMNHRVGVVEAESNRWRTIAGTGKAGFSGDAGPGSKAMINQAYSIALHRGSLFIADLQNHRIRSLDLKSGIIQTICGTGEKAMPTDGKPALGQPLMGPRSLAVDEDNLWIVLREGNSVWRIDRHTLRIHHVAGTGKKGFSGDGADAAKCTFKGPKGIAVDPGIALFIADTENHAIRRIDLNTRRVTTIMGASAEKGFNGDGDQVQRRQLARPHGVCLLSDGSLLVGDSENHRLRLLTK